MKKNKVVIFGENGLVVKEVTPKDLNDLDFMRKEIECDYVEHLQVVLGCKLFDIWFDEEGKFKEKYSSMVLAAELKDGAIKVVDEVVGNIMITSTDQWGNCECLYDFDVDIIKECQLERKLGSYIKKVLLAIV